MSRTPKITAPLMQLNLNADELEFIGKLLAEHFPMWEIIDDEVFIAPWSRCVAKLNWRTVTVPVQGEFLGNLINLNLACTQRPLDVVVDLDNRKNTIALRDIRVVTLPSNERGVQFSFRVSVVPDGKKANTLHSMKAEFAFPLNEVSAVPESQEKEVPDTNEWYQLVAALIFSCTDYGTFDEFCTNVKGSFFITPIINLENMSLVRTDSEMDAVVSVFQDLGYKHPDLLAIYHLIQFLRLTKDKRITLLSVSFNGHNKSSLYNLSQPF